MRDAYFYGISGCAALVLGITYYVCWNWKELVGRSDSDIKKGGYQKDDGAPSSESKPLLSNKGPKKEDGVSKQIAQFESRQVAAKKNSEKSNISNKNNRSLSPSSKEKSVRCPVCRKVISSDNINDDNITSFKGQKIHRACFQCFDCQINLHSHHEETVQQHAANVRTKYQCGDCSGKYQGKLQHHHHQNAVQHKKGPVVIDSSEKGNTKETMDAIGDELNEAVYFMHPKCCVCGGKFPDRLRRRPWQHQQHPPDPRQMALTVKGNWRYHHECWDTMGNPSWSDELKTYNKLQPAYSAKYLPTQLIIQLFQKDDANHNILTTLYFVWKNKEEEATQLRLEQKDACVVVLQYSLDEEAPANPNYEPTRTAGTLPQKKKQRQAKSSASKIIPLPSVSSDATDKSAKIEQLQMKLLVAEEVAPRPPTMVEPISIVRGMDRENSDNGGEPSHFLCGKLKFLKFGLEYILALHIPLIGSNPSGINTSDEDTVEGEERDKLNLAGAYLTVKIQE